jgi:hypothetical protein
MLTFLTAIQFAPPQNRTRSWLPAPGVHELNDPAELEM